MLKLFMDQQLKGNRDTHAQAMSMVDMIDNLSKQLKIDFDFYQNSKLNQIKHEFNKEEELKILDRVIRYSNDAQ